MAEPTGMDPNAPLSEPPRPEAELGTLIPHDFEPSAADPPPAPPPVVIVRERRWGWWSPLLPPMLIVAVAVIATAYRPAIRYGFRLGPEAAGRTVPRGRAPEPPPPVILKIETIPVVLPPSPESLVAPPLARALARPLPQRLRPRPPAPRMPDLARVREPAPSRFHRPEPAPPPPAAADETEFALDQIRREAAERHEQRVEADELKDHVFDLEREQRLQEIRLVDGRRQAFREELRRLLDQWGNQAGPHIVKLAGQDETPPPPGVDRVFQAETKKQGGKLDRHRRIELARAHGLPEPLILADLVREQIRRMPARNGPRSRDEAVVRAARLLLSVPLAETRMTAVGPGRDRLDDAQ